MIQQIENLFHLKESHTDLFTEIIAGTTTFMTMAYIIFTNPSILAHAGIPQDAAMVATCLGAGIATLLMGFFTNYPFALAPGMGLNAFLTYSVVLEMKIPWQTAMGIVFLEGTIILFLVMTNVRETVMKAIPVNLKRAIAVGIGLFIAFIGLQSSGIVVKSPTTLVTSGVFEKPVILSAIGLIFTALLMAKRIKGSILIGIIFTTILAILMGIAKMPERIVAVPGVSQFMTFGASLTPTYLFRVFSPALASTIFTFLLTDFFDTMGTIVAVGGEAGFLNKDSTLPRLKNVLIIDSLAAIIGGASGCSSVTTYVESAAGVSEGGRTGLTSIVTASFFFLSIFFWPLVSIVPSFATAPALIMAGFLMMTVIKEIDWNDITEGFPAFLAILTIPLTFSISKGIGYSFISFVTIKISTRRSKEIHPLMYLIALLFLFDLFFSRIR